MFQVPRLRNEPDAKDDRWKWHIATSRYCISMRQCASLKANAALTGGVAQVRAVVSLSPSMESEISFNSVSTRGGMAIRNPSYLPSCWPWSMPEKSRLAAPVRIACASVTEPVSRSKPSKKEVAPNLQDQMQAVLLANRLMALSTSCRHRVRARSRITP